ncbi:phage holin, lambda family [Pseudomonas tohonis]|uniref:phage holin, lambda family n=1 Tax=Pseudomonas tohonis TaxID=2725477 RepID=UPI0035A23B34
MSPVPQLFPGWHGRTAWKDTPWSSNGPSDPLASHLRGLFVSELRVMTMHDKDPGFWQDVLASAQNLSPAWQGAVMAVVIAVLRAIYDGKEKRWIRILLEALICGGLTLAAASVIAWLDLPESLAIAFGGAMGFLGVIQARRLALRYLNIRVTDGEGP